METVDVTESQLHHSEQTEVEQKYEPLDDSSGPSSDSTSPSFDSTQTSGGSSKSSNEGSGQSSNNSQSSSQPTSEISESKLSESENSSTESMKQSQQKQTVRLLNQVKNKNVANTEECSVNKTTSTEKQVPGILNDKGQQLDSSVQGGNDCESLPKDNLNNNKLTSETPCDVSKPTLESSVDQSKAGGRSDPSVSHDSTEIRSLNLSRRSLPRLYPDLSGCKQNTYNQDLTGSTSMNQVDDKINTSINQDDSKTSIDEVEENINNSALRKCPHEPVPGPKLHGSKFVSSSEQKPQCLCMCVVLIISVAFGVGVHHYSSYPPIRGVSSLEQFSTYVHQIKENFPNQDPKLWKTFQASTHRILRKDVSKYPAVVLMASRRKHASVALCIARNISSAFDLSIGLSSHSSLIDFKDYKHLLAAEQKLRLDSALNSAMRTDKVKSLVLENLQFLDPLAAVLFYNYCDNDYAPFKDVLIILTLYFDDEKIDDNEAVENYLETIWNKGLDTDKVKPLLSRVANHIVIVKGEGPEMLNDRCL